MSNTTRAYKRRCAAQFFEKFIKGRGIDLGCSDDKLTEDTIGFDRRPVVCPDVCGDAGKPMDFYEDGNFDYVYSSHLLENFADPVPVILEWWRLVKWGGYLILLLPHRDVYEQKRGLPSTGNVGHKKFFLPFISEPPDTLSVYDLITENLDNAHIVYVQECSAPHPEREFSIEAVIQKGFYTPLFELVEKP